MKSDSDRRGTVPGAAISRTKTLLTVRRGEITDAERIAELSGQLGYPATKKEIAARIKRLIPASQHALLVAEIAGQVIAWVQVTASRLLEVHPRAEVNGLVVDETARSAGAGKLLLQEAEKWAKRAGCQSMSVRCNVIRERAHQFYEKNGYEHYKTQKAFRKRI